MVWCRAFIVGPTGSGDVFFEKLPCNTGNEAKKMLTSRYPGCRRVDILALSNGQKEPSWWQK